MFPGLQDVIVTVAAAVAALVLARRSAPPSRTDPPCAACLGAPLRKTAQHRGILATSAPPAAARRENP